MSLMVSRGEHPKVAAHGSTIQVSELLQVMQKYSRFELMWQPKHCDDWLCVCLLSLEVMVFSMLAHATVDGVAVPPSLLPTLQSALLAAAAYRHPGVEAPLQQLFTTTSNRQAGVGSYASNKKLCLEIGSQLRNVARLKKCVSLKKRF